MKGSIIIAKIYLAYSILTDGIIWGGAFWYFLGG
jgi:hypothetical protein